MILQNPHFQTVILWVNFQYAFVKEVEIIEKIENKQSNK